MHILKLVGFNRAMNKSRKDFEWDLQTIQTNLYVSKVNSFDYLALKLPYKDLVEDSRLGEDRQKFSYEFEQVQLIGEAVNFVAKTLIYWMKQCNGYEKYNFKNKTLEPFCDDFRKELERRYSYSLA